MPVKGFLYYLCSRKPLGKAFALLAARMVEW